MVEVYKILYNIDQVDKNRLFTFATGRTRGNSMKLFKKQSRTKVTQSIFSRRVVDSWNSLPNEVVESPTLNTFKSRLNKFWHNVPYKFYPSFNEAQPGNEGLPQQNAPQLARIS